MRRDQCLFCNSRRCHHRIVTPNLSFDELACSRHTKDLEQHADRILLGKFRSNLSSSGDLRRGEPFPETISTAWDISQEHMTKLTGALALMGLRLLAVCKVWGHPAPENLDSPEKIAQFYVWKFTELTKSERPEDKALLKKIGMATSPTPE